MSGHVRPTRAEIDLGAVAANVATLCAGVAPASLCAVVKAHGYGHGAVEVARTALTAGADRLAVALVEEGAELRAAGIGAPILLLSEPPVEAVVDVLAFGLEPAVYTEAGIDALASASEAVGRVDATATPVHLKVDTGMHRVGAVPADVVAMAKAVSARPGLRLASVWTHCAVADEPDDPFTAEQLARFEGAVGAVVAAGIEVPVRHAANSAAALAHPGSRLDLVRCGIAVYGVAPSPALAGCVPLQPALRLVSEVSFVKDVEAGEALSYGQRYRLGRRSTIATVPIGYADGVPRALGESGGEVLLGGRRVPIAGTITMDQLLVDCGPDADVTTGDEVVLLGRQGDAEVTAEEWAERIGTIGYEIVCGIGPRVPRHYLPRGADG